VAVLLEDRPWLTPDQVKEMLIASATGRSRPGFLDVGRALRTSAPDTVQAWPVSTGTGSIELARGSYRPVGPDGAPLGEDDIFGNHWGTSAWAQDAWSDNTWLGNAWAIDEWAGSPWSAHIWSDVRWAGNEWTGNEWSTTGWLGNEWSTDLWAARWWVGEGDPGR
jgi:serine protease AprX